ncbi:CopG family transcriptional regulator [Spiribacter sp. C176]|uniref:CopG family transcriptional regulator n=1 Tax=Spiribacter salilacus TaxID=2664894 RepID=A0A6N7QRD4_9GAMM|nr:BrnA antitoxin family protein [Spiribacter salilacus]MRH78003.1 CopG family transcriptional regulator [Spiribacter salilacus]
MRNEYDFTKGKRGPAIPSSGKTRITIMLDDDIIEHYRAEAEMRGVGYQTAINEALRATLDTDNAPLTANKLRQLLREELRQDDGERLRFGG